jgi:predicted nucleic acid-binding Zn ribbon protein
MQKERAITIKARINVCNFILKGCGWYKTIAAINKEAEGVVSPL